MDISNDKGNSFAPPILSDPLDQDVLIQPSFLYRYKFEYVYYWMNQVKNHNIPLGNVHQKHRFDQFLSIFKQGFKRSLSMMEAIFLADWNSTGATVKDFYKKEWLKYHERQLLPNISR